jgi:hypothetical protein
MAKVGAIANAELTKVWDDREELEPAIQTIQSECQQALRQLLSPG